MAGNPNVERARQIAKLIRLEADLRSQGKISEAEATFERAQALRRLPVVGAEEQRRAGERNKVSRLVERAKQNNQQIQRTSRSDPVQSISGTAGQSRTTIFRSGEISSVGGKVQSKSVTTPTLLASSREEITSPVAQSERFTPQGELAAAKRRQEQIDRSNTKQKVVREIKQPKGILGFFGKAETFARKQEQQAAREDFSSPGKAVFRRAGAFAIGAGIAIPSAAAKIVLQPVKTAKGIFSTVTNPKKSAESFTQSFKTSPAFSAGTVVGSIATPIRFPRGVIKPTVTVGKAVTKGLKTESGVVSATKVEAVAKVGKVQRKVFGQSVESIRAEGSTGFGGIARTEIASERGFIGRKIGLKPRVDRFKTRIEGKFLERNGEKGFITETFRTKESKVFKQKPVKEVTVGKVLVEEPKEVVGQVSFVQGRKGVVEQTRGISKEKLRIQTPERTKFELESQFGKVRKSKVSSEKSITVERNVETPSGKSTNLIAKRSDNFPVKTIQQQRTKTIPKQTTATSLTQQVTKKATKSIPLRSRIAFKRPKSLSLGLKSIGATSLISSSKQSNVFKSDKSQAIFPVQKQDLKPASVQKQNIISQSKTVQETVPDVAIRTATSPKTATIPSGSGFRLFSIPTGPSIPTPPLIGPPFIPGGGVFNPFNFRFRKPISSEKSFKPTGRSVLFQLKGRTPKGSITSGLGERFIPKKRGSKVGNVRF